VAAAKAAADEKATAKPAGKGEAPPEPDEER